MKVEYESNRDDSKGMTIREVSLDNSLAEREEIAEQICKALVADGEIRLDQFNVTLTYTTRSNCKYNDEHDETFCDENTVEFDFDIAPIDYMDIIVPMAIDQIDEDWDVEEMSHLLYLEKVLTEGKYKSRELAQLTEAVNPFREGWELSF